MAWKLRQIIPFIVCGFFVQLSLMVYTINQSDAGRTHLKFRHKTTKEIRGPNMHVHTVDLMPINLRKNYEKRRLLNEGNKAHIVARRELLDYHRGVNSDMQMDEPKTDFLSLRKDNSLFDLKCGRCAVVSNSGQILGSQLGSVIDGADCVFRLNAAPTTGYELDVGRKTNIRVVSLGSVNELSTSEKELLERIHPNAIMIHGPAFKFSKGNSAKIVQRWLKTYNDTGFYTFSPSVETKGEKAFHEHTGSSRASSGGVFSTGWYAVLMAGKVCQSTTVYGMIPQNHCKNNLISTTPYSYYRPDSLPECWMYQYHNTIDSGGYRFNTERAIFKSWMSKLKLKFVNPSW